LPSASETTRITGDSVHLPALSEADGSAAVNAAAAGTVAVRVLRDSGHGRGKTVLISPAR
jgi:hypothetical protein